MKLMLFILLLPLLSHASFVPSSFSSHYEETMTSTVTGKEIKTTGKIDYKYPSHLRLEVLKPEPSTVVVNDRKTWIYQPPFIEGEKGQVTIQKGSNWPLLKAFDSFKTGLEGSKLFTHKYQGNDLIITFNKDSQKEAGIKEVIFHAKKNAKEVKSLNEFEKMTLVKADGKKQNYKFTDLKENVAFRPSNFEFTTPANTKVINN